jgi:hypothetical protein
MLALYNSPTQSTIRSHPNHLDLPHRLNELWHNYGDLENKSFELHVYTDGLRDRAPGQPFLGLGPHIDAGSLCRWADPAYHHQKRCLPKPKSYINHVMLSNSLIIHLVH